MKSDVKEKIIKINALCSTIISLSNFYNDDDEIECRVDYDKIINKLESIIEKEL